MRRQRDPQELAQSIEKLAGKVRDEAASLEEQARLAAEALDMYREFEKAFSLSGLQIHLVSSAASGQVIAKPAHRNDFEGEKN